MPLATLRRMSQTRARRWARTAVLGFVAAWTAWSVFHAAQQMAGLDLLQRARRAPDPTVGGAYAELAAAESTRPGPVGAVWLVPADDQYWRFWLSYHALPGRVTFYPLLPDAAAARPLYLVVAGPPANPPIEPRGYTRMAQSEEAGALVVVYWRQPA